MCARAGVLAFLFAAAACGLDRGREAPNGALDELSDGQIAGVLRAVNDGEVDRGRVARGRAREPQVQELGARRVDEHLLANAHLLALLGQMGASFLDSELRQELLLVDREISEQLQHATGDAFDVAYVHAEVVLSENLRQLFDRVLFEETHARPLLAHLQGFSSALDARIVEACRVWRTVRGRADDEHAGAWADTLCED